MNLFKRNKMELKNIWTEKERLREKIILELNGVTKQSIRSNIWIYDYEKDINNYIDENYAWDDKIGYTKKEDAKSFTEKIDDYARRRQAEKDEKFQKETERLKNKVKNARSPPLTWTEKYLVEMSGMSDGKYIAGQVLDSAYKTPAEYRQSIKRMRERQNYKMLKALDLKVRKIKELEVINLSTFDWSYGKDDEGYFQYDEFNNLRKGASDLRNFIVAEHDIEGKSDEEIKDMLTIDNI